MSLSNKEITKKYNSIASRYDLSEWIFEFLIFNRLRNKLLKDTKGKILEIGAGTGRNLKHYPSNCELTYIDLSEEMLKVARKRAKAMGRIVNFKVGDVQKLPFKKAEFDMVVDTLGLCTYPDPVKALKEMKRVCRKNGFIFLLEHGKSDFRFILTLQERLRNAQLNRLGCDLTRNHFEIIKNAGLNIIKRERKFFGIIYILKILNN